MIESVYKFLSENIPVYMATVEEGEARVRPVGFVALDGDKLLFATRIGGNLYKQLQANPNIECSTTNKNYEWIRIKAKANFIDDNEKKQLLLDTYPSLKKLSSDVGGLGVYYASEVLVTFCSFTSAPRTVKL